MARLVQHADKEQFERMLTDLDKPSAPPPRSLTGRLGAFGRAQAERLRKLKAAG